jgi:hypothetical protein
MDFAAVLANVLVVLEQLKKQIDELDEKVELLLDEVIGPEGDETDPETGQPVQIQDTGGLASQMIANLRKPV